jgi:hypothetical protein
MLCTCHDGWTGEACNLKNCASGCDHGDCVADGENSMKCVCQDGWRGDSCDLKNCYPSCGAYGDCGNDGTCICDDHWEGPLCDQPSCPHNCGGSSHGNCVDHTNGKYSSCKHFHSL